MNLLLYFGLTVLIQGNRADRGGPALSLCASVVPGQSSGILEEWVSFVTALEHCLPTNVN